MQSMKSDTYSFLSIIVMLNLSTEWYQSCVPKVLNNLGYLEPIIEILTPE